MQICFRPSFDDVTSGFNFWLRDHLCMSSMHLLMKFGADIFIKYELLIFFSKLKMAAAAILDLFG